MKRIKTLKSSALIVLFGMTVLSTLMFTACPDRPKPTPTKYKVTFNVEGANGALTAKLDGKTITSGTEAEKDKTVLFTAVPTEGYRVKGWTLDGAAVNDNNSTYELKVTKAVTVKVSFEAIPKYAVTFGVDGANGALTAKVDGAAINSGAQVQKGKTVTFTATPAAGYKVKGWTLDGTAVNGTNSTYSLTVSKAAAVKVSFESNAVPLPKYTVNFGVDGANGALTAKVDGAAINSGAQVEKGKTVTFTATPAEGYKVKGWTLDGTAVNGTNSTYSLTVSKEAAVKVSFESNAVPLPKYTVNFGVDGANGTLTAKVDGAAINSGAQVEKDTIVIFTAKPAEDYRVYGWTLNGTVVNDTAETYSLTIDKDVTVKVSFEDAGSPPKPRYNVYFQKFNKGSISAQVDGNTITPDTKVQKDKTVLFTATPAPGYKVQKWTLNGTPVNGTAETYSLILTNSVSVCVYFERNAPKYPVNFNVDGGNGTLKASFAGLVQLDTGDTIYEGDEVRFTAVPAEGYGVGIWTIEGGTFESGSGTPGGSYALVKVTAPVTVKVRFIKPADLIPLSKLNIEGTVLKGYTGEKPRGILIVPEYITEIANIAFMDCTGITEVHFPESLTHIDYGAFRGCNNLGGRLEFPQKLTLIGEAAFYDCNTVRILDFSKCIQPLVISREAFRGCYGITGTVKFPACLRALGPYVFWNCPNARRFDFYSCKNPPLTAIAGNAFDDINSRFRVKTGTGITKLLTDSGVAAGKIDEES